MGSDGNVWFTSTLASIGKITPDGSITEYALPSGSSPAIAITTGAPGTLWFSDWTAIGKITTAGSIQEFPLPQGVTATEGLVYGPDGNIWFGDYNSNSIGKMTQTGSVTEYPLPATHTWPFRLVVGPDHNIWFTEHQSQYVGRVTLDGVITEFLVPMSGFGSYGIVSAPDGYLYVANTSKAILQVSVTGQLTSFKTVRYMPYYLAIGPDKQLWIGYGFSIGEFNLTSHVFSPTVRTGTTGDITVGADGDLWFANPYYSAIAVYEESLTTIGVRLNGEMSIEDPTYGFELGYARGKSTTTQTIPLPMGESVRFQNLDTISHSAAFLGNASPSPSTWPSTFTGSTTKSPAGTAIGTTGFATGSLDPGVISPVYETGLPGFYMIGCEYHYISNEMRTVIIVH